MFRELIYDPRRRVSMLAVVGLGACAASGTSTSGAQLAADPRATFFHAGFSAGPAVFTDAAGHLVEERRHEPFGAAIGTVDVAARDLNALNRRTDAATGWSDHGARWLAPETARWLTSDPPVAGPSAKLMLAPWGLHPFQYVDQNPVLYWDPDGREPAKIESPLPGVWNAPAPPRSIFERATDVGRGLWNRAVDLIDVRRVHEIDRARAEGRKTLPLGSISEREVALAWQNDPRRLNPDTTGWKWPAAALTRPKAPPPPAPQRSDERGGDRGNGSPLRGD